MIFTFNIYLIQAIQTSLQSNKKPECMIPITIHDPECFRHGPHFKGASYDDYSRTTFISELGGAYIVKRLSLADIGVEMVELLFKNLPNIKDVFLNRINSQLFQRLESLIEQILNYYHTKNPKLENIDIKKIISFHIAYCNYFNMIITFLEMKLFDYYALNDCIFKIILTTEKLDAIYNEVGIEVLPKKSSCGGTPDEFQISTETSFSSFTDMLKIYADIFNKEHERIAEFDDLLGFGERSKRLQLYDFVRNRKYL